MIKAIQTRYNGYHFRSRLEARWAVFFDALGIKYFYEMEGFDLGPLGNGAFYLPDFWLPQVGMWAEVKGRELSHPEKVKAEALCALTGYACLFLIGPPDFKPYFGAVYVEVASGEFDILEMDFVLSTEYLHENRFYANCGGGYESMNEFNDLYQQAVFESRSARFEFGESPNPRANFAYST